MCSVIAIRLFSYLKFSYYINGYDVGFYNIKIAMISLFKVASPSDWFRIMHDSVRGITPINYCFNIESYKKYETYGQMGCGTNWAYLFFIIY